MTSTDQEWLDTQIARWQREKKRAETILQHLYGLRNALYEQGNDIEPTAQLNLTRPTQHEPNQPIQPYEPTQPIQPYEPTQPVQPYEPNQPIQPYEPNQPIQPYEPNQQVQLTREVDADTLATTNQQVNDSPNEQRRSTKRSKTKGHLNGGRTHKATEVRTKAKPLAKDRVYALLVKRGVNTIPRLDALLQEDGPRVSRQGIANALEQLRIEGRVVREDATETGVKYQWRALVQGGLFESDGERSS